MSYINRIRDRLNVRRPGRRGSGGDSLCPAKDLPLDHQLTFRRDANEEWKFRDGRIWINSIDVEDVINYEERDVSLWCGIIEAVTEYRDMVIEKGGGGRSRFFARVDSIREKILSNMKRLYDEKTSGMYLSFDDGEVLLNNFNVRAFLAMYHMMPTKKARQFLLGLKSTLALILVSKNGTPKHERVHRVIQQLYEEVINALEIPPLEIRRLPASCGDNPL